MLLYNNKKTFNFTDEDAADDDYDYAADDDYAGLTCARKLAVKPA